MKKNKLLILAMLVTSVMCSWPKKADSKKNNQKSSNSVEQKRTPPTTYSFEQLRILVNTKCKGKPDDVAYVHKLVNDAEKSNNQNANEIAQKISTDRPDIWSKMIS